MPEISAYVKELLEEEEFGTAFHGRIDERVSSLNLSQLTKMHAHLEKAAENAQFYVWQDANAKVDSHFGGFLILRQDEKNKQDQEKRDREKKAEFKKVRKEALQKEEEKIKHYLEAHCLEVATAQIKDEEKDRKVAERVRIRVLVYKNEKYRNRLLLVAGVVLALGIASGVAFFLSTLFLMISIIAGALFISLTIVGFTMVVTRLEVTEVSDKEIKKRIEERAIQLKFEAENELIRKEEEFRRKVDVDKEESRVRKKALKEHRELERQIREMDREERRLEALQRQSPLEGSHYSLLTDGSSDDVQANTHANSVTIIGRPGGGIPGSFGSPPRRLPPIAPRSPIATGSGRHGGLNPLGGSTVTWNTQGADTRQGTLGSDELNADSHSLFHRRDVDVDIDDDDYVRYSDDDTL